MTETCGCYRISILSDRDSWLNFYLPALRMEWERHGHSVHWIHDPGEIKPGDFAFFLSCSKIVNADARCLNRHNLVVHESDLPKGRGWSPLTWQILEGKNDIPITLFEAADKVDNGDIYLQDVMCFAGDELVDELRAVQAQKTIELCLAFTVQYPEILERRRSQSGEPTYYPRRRPKDSELDSNKSIVEQFKLLRVTDNQRYPAFFWINGAKYALSVEKARERTVHEPSGKKRKS